MDDDTQEQVAKQRGDQLKAWQFKPGVSGNPGGRPKGSKSLKTFAREYLESLSDEDKLEFLKGMDKLDIFKMAEGNPDSKIDTPPTNLVVKTDVDLDALAAKMADKLKGDKI